MIVSSRRSLLALASVSALSLAACGSSGSSGSSPATSAGASGDWPRTITHEKGETTIESQPQRVVTTTISATGTLLAIGAPLVASAATTPSEITDDKGFFSQWASVADEKGVEVLYPNLEYDREALMAAAPDLVIISTAGNDSVIDHYDDIAAEFPTIVIDYSAITWQDLAQQLGEATGLEDRAAEVVAEFDQYVAQAASSLTIPDGGVSIVSYNGAGQDQGIGKVTGPHGGLMAALGMEVIEADESLDTRERPRNDFSFVTFENLSQAIGGETVFLLTGTEETVSAFTAEPVLANLPAVTSGRVYPLGPTSFRLDYYSGKLMVDAVVDALG